MAGVVADATLFDARQYDAKMKEITDFQLKEKSSLQAIMKFTRASMKWAYTRIFSEAYMPMDFLSMYFQKMYKPIPLIYNLVLAMLWRHPENVDLDKVKVVHYCAAGSKPWRYTGKEENMQREDIKVLVQNWWDIYNDESLDFKAEEDSIPEAETLSNLQQIRAISLLSAIPTAPAFIPAPSAA